MKRARVAHTGQDQWVEVLDDGALRRADGATIPADEVIWLPPVLNGASAYALGLNYADHNRELGFAVRAAKPLIFMKGGNAFVGHCGTTDRPDDANQMHPECELVAVIGSPARQVPESEALDYVAGYTIANDYAIREYLENYYRPNARVKNRDCATPIGPWIVDAADVPNPQSLRLLTRVNGVVVQEGTTADMLLGVAGLIAHLSRRITLMPGDLILTGTPQGVHFCAVGDVVECEIAEIGTLTNRLVAP